MNIDYQELLKRLNMKEEKTKFLLEVMPDGTLHFVFKGDCVELAQMFQGAMVSEPELIAVMMAALELFPEYHQRMASIIKVTTVNNKHQ